MRILHIITNTELGGAQKVCIDLCCRAVEDGHEVAVTSMTGGYLWNQLPDTVSKYYLKNMVKPINPKYDLKVLKELRKVIKDFRPDIIQLHSSKAGVLGRLAGFSMRKHIVYTVHGFDSIRLKHSFFLPLERIMQKFCGGIVAVSDYDKENLISEKISQNVQTIYNGISEVKENAEIKLPDCCTGKKIIMTIARIAAPKRLDLFLETAKSFLSSDYQFVWIGGDSEHSVDELYQIYDVPNNVVLLGNVVNASSYLFLCDLFILLSDFEGLPITIIEAMSKSKPIVASDVGGIKELVDNTNGQLIKNELLQVTDAIEKILGENVDNKFGNASYKKYRENFTLDGMWSKYDALYRNILNK